MNKTKIALMPAKKPFETPRVIQTVEVLLERDLLQGPSSMGSVQATGHEVEEHTEYRDTNWD